MRKLKPVTPGELLLEEFLRPMGISRYRLAKEISVPTTRIADIVAGKRAVTADTDLRLCRFFGLSNGYWLRAQAAHVKLPQRAEKHGPCHTSKSLCVPIHPALWAAANSATCSKCCQMAV